MTYKESIDAFRLLLKKEALIRGQNIPEFDNKEIMVMMSMVQSELQSRYKLSRQQKDIYYVSGETLYDLSTQQTYVVSSSFLPHQLGQYKRYNDIMKALEDIQGRVPTRILVEPGDYYIYERIKISDTGQNNDPNMNLGLDVEGRYVSFYFKKGAKVNANVNYANDAKGAFYCTGGAVIRILGNAIFNNFGTAPMLFCHAGFAAADYDGEGGHGDMIWEFDECNNLGDGYCMLFEDTHGICKGKLVTNHSGSTASPIIITNTEAYNRAIIEIEEISSYSSPVSIEIPGGTTTKTIFRNSFLKKYSGSVDVQNDPVINGAGTGGCRVQFENCKIKNYQNNSSAHGLLGSQDCHFTLLDTGIYTTHSSSKSVIYDTALRSFRSKANKDVDPTVTQEQGTLTIDSTFEI